MSLSLNDSQRVVLAKIVEALLPSLSLEEMEEIKRERHDPPSRFQNKDELNTYFNLSYKDLDVVNQMEKSLAKFVSPSSFNETALLLTILSYSAGSFLLTKRTTIFSELSRNEREKVLMEWGESPIPLKRQAIKALKSLAFISFYAGFDKDFKNPTWSIIGYPGPDPERNSLKFTQPTIPFFDYKFIEIKKNIELEADIVIVGSGAGGGVAAGVLSFCKGKRVIIIEKGVYVHPKDMSLLEKDAFERMYEGGGLIATKDFSIPILAGATFGGGTTVNWSCSLRTPNYVREEWASKFGLTQFLSPEFQKSVDNACDRINVHAENITYNKPNQILVDGLKKIGGSVHTAPQNTVGAHNCGWCCFGCRYGEKQGTVVTWLRDAANNGAEFIQGGRVDKVITKDGAASGVIGKTNEGYTFKVKAAVVIVSGGALNTPNLLRRSGLKNAHIGRNLRLHPASGIIGVFEEDVDSHLGGIMTTVSNDLADIHGDHYGVKVEIPSIHPGLVSAILPFEGAAKHRSRMMDFKKSAAIVILCRDKSSGTVSQDKDGFLVVDYALCEEDKISLLQGYQYAAKVMVAAGAIEIGAPQNSIGTYKTTALGLNDPGFHTYLQKIIDTGVHTNHCQVFSAHQMGTAKMGVSPKVSACNPDGETWEIKNLYVFDTSLFPTPSGANPMVTCESIVYMLATRLKEKIMTNTSRL